MFTTFSGVFVTFFKPVVMKIIFPLILFFVLVSVVQAQKNNPGFDEKLAKSLGADDYGMKKYVLVILKTGENTTLSREDSSKAFRGHMENMEQLVEEGKLVVAGPLGKNENSYRGIFILNVPTVEEAKLVVNTDPAIVANLLTADLYEWYGSAALPEYLPASDKIWKVKP